MTQNKRNVRIRNLIGPSFELSYLIDDEYPVIELLSLQHRMQLTQENREMFFTLSKWDYDCYLKRKMDSRFESHMHPERYLKPWQADDIH